MNPEVEIRDMNKEDSNFIFATWLRGLYFGNEWYGEIDRAVFFENYHKVIEGLLTRCKVRVACLKDDSEVILGYSVAEPKTLHYIFVKPVWRKFGIGKALVDSELENVTHLTKVGRSILKSKMPAVKFNPFLI